MIYLGDKVTMWGYREAWGEGTVIESVQRRLVPRKLSGMMTMKLQCLVRWPNGKEEWHHPKSLDKVK